MSFSGTKGYITKPKSGVMLDPLHPLSRGLAGCWLFNEGTGSKTYDISGHGNHGVLTNMSPNTQGSGWGGSQFGGGLQFDNSDDYVDCGDSSTLDMTDAVTISAWIKTGSDFSVTEYLFANLRSYQTSGYSFYKYQFGGGLGFRGGNGSAGDNLLSEDLSWLNNHVYHVAISYENLNATFYRDGVDVGSDTISWAGSLGSATSNHRIGVEAPGTNPFDGLIDEFRIYNRALSSTEIEQLYNNPFCNLLQVPIRRYSVVAAPPVGAIMNQFQRINLGADLYNGTIIL